MAPYCSATERGALLPVSLAIFLNIMVAAVLSVRSLPTMASLSSYDLGLNFSRVRVHRLTKYKVGLFGAKINLSQVVWEQEYFVLIK